MAVGYSTYTVNFGKKHTYHISLTWFRLISTCINIRILKYLTCIRGSKCKFPHLCVAVSYSTYIVTIRTQHTLHIAFTWSHLIIICMFSWFNMYPKFSMQVSPPVCGRELLYIYSIYTNTTYITYCIYMIPHYQCMCICIWIFNMYPKLSMQVSPPVCGRELPYIYSLYKKTTYITYFTISMSIYVYTTCIRGSKCKSPHLSVAVSYCTYIVNIYEHNIHNILHLHDPTLSVYVHLHLNI